MDKHQALDAINDITKKLEEWWSNPRRSRFTRRIPGRILGGRWDQPPIPPGIANPYWEIIRNLPLEDHTLPWDTRPEPTMYFFTDDNDFAIFGDRTALCVYFSWSIPSPADMVWMLWLLGGRGVVEMGAGIGYWAWQMRQAGISVRAFDPKGATYRHFVAREEWSPVQCNDSRVLRRMSDRVLFLCWPGYTTTWATRALREYRGPMVFYAGEGDGGCCADDTFFARLSRSWDWLSTSPYHVSYWGIHCWLRAYVRRAIGQTAVPTT